MSETLSLTTEEKKLVRDKNKDLTDGEFIAFLSVCDRYRLNPLANQIYSRVSNKNEPAKRAVNYVAQIDGYRLIADRTGFYAGCENPTFEYVDGDQSKPLKSTFTVYKLVGGTRCPFTASAFWNEYLPPFENQQFMWRRMPNLMLGKCAEALALRRAFPAELSGLYTVEEMHQSEESTEDAGDRAYRESKVGKETQARADERKNAAKQKRMAELDATSKKNDLQGNLPIDDRTESPREVVSEYSKAMAKVLAFQGTDEQREKFMAKVRMWMVTARAEDQLTEAQESDIEKVFSGWATKETAAA